jgi:hypothetical protein
MLKCHLFLAIIATVIVGCSRRTDLASTDVETETSMAAPVAAGSGFYSIDDYDPARDAASDLLKTIDRAKADNKRIILEIGGRW